MGETQAKPVPLPRMKSHQAAANWQWLDFSAIVFGIPIAAFRACSGEWCLKTTSHTGYLPFQEQTCKASPCLVTRDAGTMRSMSRSVFVASITAPIGTHCKFKGAHGVRAAGPA